MSRKQIRVSSVILVRWLETNKTEVFQDLGKVFDKYSSGQVGITRRNLYTKDIESEDGYNTQYINIRKSNIQ
jgi:hypothetical protein